MRPQSQSSEVDGSGGVVTDGEVSEVRTHRVWEGEASPLTVTIKD